MEKRADMRYIKAKHGRLTPPVYPPTPPAQEEPPDLLSVMQAQLAVLNTIADALAGVGGGSSDTTIASEKAKNLRVTTLPLGAANKEVTYQFAIGTKCFTIHARNGNAVRMSTQQGIVSADPATESKDPRFTLKANTVYNEAELNIRDFTQTFYFACGVANEVLEIIIGV